MLSLVLTAIAWKELAEWCRSNAGAPCVAGQQHPHRARIPALRALYVEYALNAAGWVPHMIFLVDFVARGLGQGLQAGAEYWVLFGIGATDEAGAGGRAGRSHRLRPALRLAFTLQAAGVAIPALGLGTAWLIIQRGRGRLCHRNGAADTGPCA